MIKLSYKKIHISAIGDQIITINQLTPIARKFSILGNYTSLKEALDRSPDDLQYEFSDNEARHHFEELRTIAHECDWDLERLLDHPSINRE